ncbi:trehalose operon transcriptional repressor [Vibrio cholerae]|nr:trehalose operon transcriptional repressor [Vibrio cholerae]
MLSFLFPNIFSVDPGYREAGKLAADLLIEQLCGSDHGCVHLTQMPVSR